MATSTSESGALANSASESDEETLSFSESLSEAVPYQSKDDRTVSDVVADLGMGPAQLYVMLLSSGAVYFCDGVELKLVNIIATATAKDFNLLPTQRAGLSTVTMCGLMMGTFASGYFGDGVGRRAPTMWCLAFTAVLGLMCSLAPDYFVLLTGRSMLGFAMGIGIPPSTALVSEITPEAWRIPTKAFSSAFAAIGGLFVAIMAALDDPTYQNLHWRHLMVMCSIPPAFWWAISQFLLRESPVFLASVGKHEEAKVEFRRLQQMNGKFDLNVDYVPPRDQAEMPDQAPRRPVDAVRTLFSRKYWYTTTALLVACFAINLVSTGDAYASPQVLVDHTSELEPGWLFVVKYSIAVAATVAAGLLAQVVPRKTSVILALVILSTVCISFATCAQWDGPRPPFISAVFMFGAHGSVVGNAIGTIVIYQLSVEIYPTTAAATGGAVVIGGGRIASVIAPMMFETMRESFHWESFYYAMAATCMVAIISVAFMEPPKPYRPGTPATPKADKTDLFVSYGTMTHTWSR